MAYRNLINAALGSSKNFDAFKIIRDFVTSTGVYAGTGIGWTLVDAFYAVNSTTITANDWFRIRTVGEGGADRYEVVCKVTTTGLRFFTGFDIQGTTTAAVTYNKIVGSAVTDVLINFTTWTGIYIYGNLDFVAIICPISAALSMIQRFGIIANVVVPAGTRYIEHTTGAVSAGSNVNIQVGNSNHPTWAVGNRIQIFDSISGETSLITANNTTTNTITVDALTYGYASDAYVSTVFPYFVDSTSSKSTGGGMAFLLTANLTGTTYGGNVSMGYAANYSLYSYDYGPNPITLNYPCQELGCCSTSSIFMATYPYILRGFKYATEATIFTRGAENWRYFSVYNESTVGFYYLEV